MLAAHASPDIVEYQDQREFAAGTKSRSQRGKQSSCVYRRRTDRHLASARRRSTPRSASLTAAVRVGPKLALRALRAVHDDLRLVVVIGERDEDRVPASRVRFDIGLSSALNAA